MNDALKMQISAFVDGELPENESELLLRRLSQDAGLRQQVSLYMAIGRLIRREPEVSGMSELRDRIAAALGEEPAQAPVEQAHSRSRFAKPAIGAAIAASVAVLALFALRPDVPQESGGAFAGRTVPETQAISEATDDALLRQLYIHHNPILVTWQLEHSVSAESATRENAADSDVTEVNYDGRD